MSFPVRFVTIAICLTFVVCAMVRELGPLASKMIDLRIFTTIRAIQEEMKHPPFFHHKI